MAREQHESQPPDLGGDHRERAEALHAPRQHVDGVHQHRREGGGLGERDQPGGEEPDRHEEAGQEARDHHVEHLEPAGVDQPEAGGGHDVDRGPREHDAEQHAERAEGVGRRVVGGGHAHHEGTEHHRGHAAGEQREERLAHGGGDRGGLHVEGAQEVDGDVAGLDPLGHVGAPEEVDRAEQTLGEPDVGAHPRRVVAGQLAAGGLDGGEQHGHLEQPEGGVGDQPAERGQAVGRAAPEAGDEQSPVGPPRATHKRENLPAAATRRNGAARPTRRGVPRSLDMMYLDIKTN